MTSSIPPEQLQDLLAGYVLYDLSPEESAALASLLAANPSLGWDIEQLQQILVVAYDGGPVSPPAHLRQAILRASSDLETGAAPPSAPAGPSPEVGRLRPGRWRLALGAALAALIAGLSLSNIVLWRTLQLERASRLSGETIAIALGSPNDPTMGQAEVVLNPETLEGSLTVENLPPLEPGSVYVLWTVLNAGAPATADQKNAILTSVFTVDEQGNLSQPIDLPAVYRRDRSLIKAVAITKERAAAPQAHQSAPILIQPI
ncbi:anti-sigma factor [Nodosilinea nodulosa]|uniref:anti-sigma factor n=1 Tax=Nodosilinea nodulosa TaxID=416001 RepID=UPI0002D640AA|nr:anti-sigma factor [Nodosilinea nodulosa]